MNYGQYKIPEKNGELLCIPSLALIPRLIITNKDKFKTYNFYINEVHIHDFRKRIREKVLKLSRQYTSELAIKINLNTSADTIILTGHQPTFYHPGILIKNLLLNRIALSENSTAINLIVDTDTPPLSPLSTSPVSPHGACPELSRREGGGRGRSKGGDRWGVWVNIPSYSNGIEIKKEPLLLNPSPIPYESSPAPSMEDFGAFIKRIDEDLSNPRLKNLYENFSKFKKMVGEGRRDFKTLTDFMTFIRRKYEEELGSRYLEVPLSNICDTNEFIAFFISLAKESEGFVNIYNYHLAQYRKKHKLRYHVNPFPDLKIKDKRYELPFWHFYPHTYSQRLSMPISDGETPEGIGVGVRGRVFAEYNGDELKIYFENGIEINLKRNETEKAIEIIKKNKIKLRPRAITLTLFSRLFISDVFVHGVSGAKYDRITDEIIRDFYKVVPPEFITTSLTLYPPLQPPLYPLMEPALSEAEGKEGEGGGQKGGINGGVNKIKELKRKVRDMRYNPERYVIPSTPPLEKGGWGDLIKEKEHLISLLKKGNGNKKEISIRLNEINEMLYQKIEPAEKEIEERIKVFKKQQQEIEAIQRRDYPYFLFSPEEIINLLPLPLSLPLSPSPFGRGLG